MTPTADEIGAIRALIPDDAAVFGPNENEYMFTDEQIGHYYNAASGNKLRASAFAVLAIAVSEALINKVIKTQDLSTDGAKVAEALIKKADTLLKAADAADSDVLNNAFDIIDYGWGGHVELTEREWHL